MIDVQAEMAALEAQIAQENGAIEARAARFPGLQGQLEAARAAMNTAYNDLIQGSATVAQHGEARAHVQTLEQAAGDVENDITARKARRDEAQKRLTRLQTFQCLTSKIDATKEKKETFFDEWRNACVRFEAIFVDLRASAKEYQDARNAFVAEATPLLPSGSYSQTKQAAADLLRELHETTGAPTDEIALSVIAGFLNSGIFEADNGPSWVGPTPSSLLKLPLDDLEVSEATKFSVLNGFREHKTK